MGAVKLTDRTVSAMSCPAGRKDALFLNSDLQRVRPSGHSRRFACVPTPIPGRPKGSP